MKVNKLSIYDGVAPVSSIAGELDITKGLHHLLETIEYQLIFKALAETAYNQAKAARILNISRGALQHKLRKYKVEPKSPTEGA